MWCIIKLAESYPYEIVKIIGVFPTQEATQAHIRARQDIDDYDPEYVNCELLVREIEKPA